MAVDQTIFGNALGGIRDANYFDALLARRNRGIQGMARAQQMQLSDSLGSRGLGQSGVLAAGYGQINQSAAQESGNAASDIFGQQFALQQQKGAESRAYTRQLQLQNLSFEQQAALMRLSSELEGSGGGSVWSKLAKGAAGALGGFVTGGPAGAAAGGLNGFFG